MGNVQQAATRSMLGDLFTRYVATDPGMLIRVRVTRKSDGAVVEITLAELMKNIRVAYEQHAAILGGEVVALGEDVTVEVVP
jgi:hypothetical protein